MGGGAAGTPGSIAGPSAGPSASAFAGGGCIIGPASAFVVGGCIIGPASAGPVETALGPGAALISGRALMTFALVTNSAKEHLYFARNRSAISKASTKTLDEESYLW